MRGRSWSGRTRILRVVALLGVMAAAAWPGAAEGQRRGQGDSLQRDQLIEEARAVIEARLRAFFGESVKRRLALSDAEMEAVREALGTFDTERRALAREEREIRRSLGPALGGTAETLSDAEARRILERMVELRVEEARLFRREQEALLQTLSPVQLVQLYQLRGALENRIRQLRGEGPGRPGPPWRGRGGTR